MTELQRKQGVLCTNSFRAKQLSILPSGMTNCFRAKQLSILPSGMTNLFEFHIVFSSSALICLNKDAFEGHLCQTS